MSAAIRDASPDRWRRRVFSQRLEPASANTDAFWDGAHLELTPAYDLSPVFRSGQTASQALAFNRRGDRSSYLDTGARPELVAVADP